MEIQELLVFYLLVLTCSLSCIEGLNRSSFPTNFIFGAGSSAYQYEGAAKDGGREPSIWDIFTTAQSEKISDHSNGDVATEFYYRYKEDIALIKYVGFDSFRFSISWSRVLPKGKISGGVNQQGVKFYNNLIDELLLNGMQPFVTLFHWDVPQALEDEYQGFLSHNIIEDYLDYADFCFKEFGDRVKYWVTLNEPNLFSSYGYDTGTRAPGRCSNYIGNCTVGNSGTEPYVVTHNLLLSHASAVNLYREKYQAYQNGSLGISISTEWMVPKFSTDASRKAASRAVDFLFGWIIHPTTYGDYPKSMRDLVGTRLPKFTIEQSEMVKGSVDFLGVNYYTSRYADDSNSSSRVNLSYTTDSHVNETTEKNGIPIGQLTSVSWIYIYLKGLQKILLYLKKEYKNPPIYITENGLGDSISLPIKDQQLDNLRIKYHSLHLSYILKAIKDGVDVRGYYVWSFLDNFEWDSGYTVRFGITFVDFRNGLKRYFKLSALWFQKFLQKENVSSRPFLYSESTFGTLNRN